MIIDPPTKGFYSMMNCNVCNILLRTLYVTFSTLAKPRLRTLYLAFYFVILYLAKDHLFAVVRIAYIFLFLGASEFPKYEPHRELIQIHVIFKHGHRAPFRIYKTDAYQKDHWKEGLGQLTNLGKLQMFIVGDQLKNRYSDLVTSNPNEIGIQSSEAQRSLYSAYSFLAGMYPPDEEWTFTDIPWQPIPVSYVAEAEDKYLQSNPNCNKYEEAKDHMERTVESLLFTKKYEDFYAMLRNESGQMVSTLKGAGDLYKTLSVERDLNMTVPDWALRSWDELIHQTDVGYYRNFMTKVQHRLRGGPILKLLLDRMKERIEGENTNIKVYAYSGHGSNVAAIQCSLQLYDMKHAPHAATIVFELYREITGNHTVRYVLFNSTHPERYFEEPFVFKFHGCTEYCPVEFFEDFIQDLHSENWKKECNERYDRKKDYITHQYAEVVNREGHAHSSASTLYFKPLLIPVTFILLVKYIYFLGK